jgi:hypothetical protein
VRNQYTTEQRGKLVGEVRATGELGTKAVLASRRTRSAFGAPPHGGCYALRPNRVKQPMYEATISLAGVLLILAFSGCTATSSGPTQVAKERSAAPARRCGAEAEVQPVPNFGPVGNPIVVRSAFAFPPAQEIKPCVWSGTFAADIVLHADRDAHSPLVKAQFVRAKSVALPRRAGEPAKLRISWPIHADAWAPAASFPFALHEPLDIVKGTYWLAPGARVEASAGEKEGTAVVSRPYSKDLTHPAFTKRVLLEQVPCSKLTLPNEGLFLPEATGTDALMVPGVEKWFNLVPGTELYTQPGQGAQGRVVARNVARLDQRGNWNRIRSYASYGGPHEGGDVDFIGWVPDTSITPGLRVTLAFGPIWLEPTHKAPRRLPLRRSADAAAPIVGTTAKGVPFRAVRSERGFVEVRLPGLDGAGLWIAEPDLCDAQPLR